MVQKQQTREKREKMRGILYGSLLVLFLVVVELGIYSALQKQIHRDMERDQWFELNEMMNTIRLELTSVISDLQYITQSDLSRDYLTTESHHSSQYITDLMYRISSVHKRYDQLRLLDTLGNEKIRINFTHMSGVEIVPTANLQNKADRYYFHGTINLDPNEIYISRFDLNIEEGEIERPFKPVIRMGVPVYTNGKKIGVGIINYLGQHILDKLDKLNQHHSDEVYMVSYDGYYLKAPDSEICWGFMIPERAHFTLQNDLPDLWEMAQRKDSGMVANKRGEFYFNHIDLSATQMGFTNQEERGRGALLIMHVPASVIRKRFAELISGLTWGFAAMAPLLFVLGWFLGRYQVHQRWLFKKLEQEATHDTLTGLFNRKAFMEHLKREISSAKRTKRPLTLGFIDLNDLKKMNDNYGHEAGDLLIQSASEAMSSCIRATDFAARVGGDEFMILFPECSEESAVHIIERIHKWFETVGLRELRHAFSFSYGCTELLEIDTSPELFIARADEKMYENKVQQKTDKGEFPR